MTKSKDTPDKRMVNVEAEDKDVKVELIFTKDSKPDDSKKG